MKRRLLPLGLVLGVGLQACGSGAGDELPAEEGSAPADGATLGLFTLLRDGDASVSVAGQFVRVPSLARVRAVPARALASTRPAALSRIRVKGELPREGRTLR